MTRHRPLRPLAASVAVLLLASCAADIELRAASAGFDTALADGAAGLYAAGKEHFAAGRLGSAVQAFRRASHLDPGSVEALNGLGAAYDRLGRSDLADDAYLRALTLAPDDPVTLNNMGWSRLLRGQPQLAAVYLHQAAALRPDDATIAGNRRVLAARSDGTPPEEPIPVLERPTGPYLERRAADRLLLVTADGPAAPVVESDVPAVAALPEAAQLAMAVPETPAGPVSRPMPTAATTAFTGLSVEVSNGVGRTRMAARAAAWLGEAGVPVTRLTNAASWDHAAAAVFYRDEAARPAAEALAALLPTAPRAQPAPDMAADVRLVLGRDLLVLDDRLMKGKTP
ncbi:tetratricopeptide repeat protein [Caenispirillum bisanense]|uniref:Tetratricopeptide repeat-containing protein n=1 Tax=Caenispirillum bisanense TaxID=414052 RepID=A0A286GD59_9PROT|nr:LytR C-terminal domain-containing protein [Caenispirillum bisanense]SOD93475.1 Tetratricopeptide repeat-containing protein [Caenispirillum bisanense]